MKKFVYTIYFLMMSLGLSSCRVGSLALVYNDKTSIEEDGLRVDAAHKPITGIYQKYDKTMLLKEEAHYVNGRLSGLYKAYNNSGKVILEASYK
ncbi:MAG: hypothetical protein J6B00_05135, partial [Alphaproteobacteria bacterium]|nr:hypothetical protein [Alphaproteobacteria bacterium]